jgi:hypothetical protein
VEFINYTGDTKNGGTSTNIDAARFTAVTSTGAIMDDLYICNSSGSTNNDFLGDVRVKRRHPDGNGASSQLVGSDGNSTDNHLLVSEVPPSTSNYVAGSTVGHRDLYTFDNIGISGDVLGVQTVVYAQKSDAGTSNIKTVARSSGGTVVTGSSQALSTTWDTYGSAVMETDADGAAWTVSTFDSHQFGCEVA